MGADDFKLNVPLNQALFGFGDAVCVPVIEWIARNYLNPVWEEEFETAQLSSRAVPVATYRKRGRAQKTE
jgi:DNA (cytosine-5)-methyltransferase 1